MQKKQISYNPLLTVHFSEINQQPVVNQTNQPTSQPANQPTNRLTNSPFIEPINHLLAVRLAIITVRLYIKQTNQITTKQYFHK